MNILQRLNEIKKEIKYIQKDKKVESYMAVTHDAVTSATRDCFVRHGVMVVPNEIASQTMNTAMTTGKGIPYVRFEAKYRIDFINADEPTEKVSVEFSAHALDHGDKAPGKAHSYATKYAILKILQLETGEDEESREAMLGTKKRGMAGGTITPTTGARDALTKDQIGKVDKIASNMLDMFNGGRDVSEPYEVMEDAGLDNEEKIYLWTWLDSKMRSALKKHHEAQKGERNAVRA